MYVRARMCEYLCIVKILVFSLPIRPWINITAISGVARINLALYKFTIFEYCYHIWSGSCVLYIEIWETSPEICDIICLRCHFGFNDFLPPYRSIHFDFSTNVSMEILLMSSPIYYFDLTNLSILICCQLALIILVDLSTCLGMECFFFLNLKGSLMTKI